MIEPPDGDLLNSPTARPCTRPALLATSRAKIVTSFSHVRPIIAPGKAEVRLRPDDADRHIDHQDSRRSIKGVHT